ISVALIGELDPHDDAHYSPCSRCAAIGRWGPGQSMSLSPSGRHFGRDVHPHRHSAIKDVKDSHFRPEIYEAKFLFAVAKRRLPVKIAGQLFFDASHRPCDGDTPRDSSVHGTLWEIHPIYSIDVCKHSTLAQCPAHDSSVWQPLEQWLEQGANRRCGARGGGCVVRDG